MKIADRMSVWRKIAQTVPVAVQDLNMTQIPGFNSSIFSVRPDFVQDVLKLINTINKGLSKLSSGQLKFSDVWMRPGADQITYGSVKNLFEMAKKIHETITSSGQSYSLPQIRGWVAELTRTLNSTTFPEAEAGTIKSDIAGVLQGMTSKLGS